MADQNQLRCVDCGMFVVVCDHAVERLLSPERSYQAGVEDDLRAQLAASEARCAELERVVRAADLMAEAISQWIGCHDCGEGTDVIHLPMGCESRVEHAMYAYREIRALLAQQHAEGPGDGVTNPRELNVVEDWSEVPDFASEAEEQAYWSTHSFGLGILNQMRRVDENGGE